MADEIIKGQQNKMNNIQFYFSKVILNMQQKMHPVDIRDNDFTIDLISHQHLSIARFGDGEMNIIVGNSIDFQEYHKLLADKLQEVLITASEKCIVGIPPAINVICDLKRAPQEYWIDNMKYNRSVWLKMLAPNKTYYSANITRPYIDYKNKEKSARWFEKLKSIWNKRKVILVEGKSTRFGIGNDLLSKTMEVKRILCPERNSFDFYEQIMEEILKWEREYLVLIALGPTATALAYDLALQGYQAIDIGHCDLEYEWFIRNCSRKIRIPGKYTNEIMGGNRVDLCDDSDYLKQIAANVGV